MTVGPERGRLESPRENLGARRLGRAGFVGVVGAGVATLFYGKALSRLTSGGTSPFAAVAGGGGAALCLRGEALRRLPRAAPGGACGCDARLRNGREAASTRARCPGAGRDPGDVWVQERQVGGADRAGRQAGVWVL